jgi:hypothetical protein
MARAILPDSLTFSQSARLVRLAGLGYIVVGNGRGGLNETPLAALLDSAAQFVRLIGRQGQGPGEISVARLALAMPGDSVWIFDGSARKHVFTPDLQFAHRENFAPGSSLARLSGGKIVVAAVLRTAAQAGLPLHFVASNGTILQSFGVDEPEIDARRLAADGDDVQSFLAREIVPGYGGDFWVFSAPRFLFERFDSAGHLRFRGQHALDGWYRQASEAKPGMGAFKGAALTEIQISSDVDIVWLVYHVPNRSYKPPPWPSPFMLSGYAAMHDVVIEAFSASQSRVVANRRFPSTFAARVQNAPDVLAFIEVQPDGTHTYRLMSLSVAH